MALLARIRAEAAGFPTQRLGVIDGVASGMIKVNRSRTPCCHGPGRRMGRGRAFEVLH